jgi:transcriptional regulator with XRE-family HTH domain
MSVSTMGGRSSHSWTTVLDGTRLRKLRRERGLSQEQLAGRAGISLATVARLERQSRAPCRGRTLARLAVALDEQPASMRLPEPAAD